MIDYLPLGADVPLWFGGRHNATDGKLCGAVALSTGQHLILYLAVFRPGAHVTYTPGGSRFYVPACYQLFRLVTPQPAGIDLKKHEIEHVLDAPAKQKRAAIKTINGHLVEITGITGAALRLSDQSPPMIAPTPEIFRAAYDVLKLHVQMRGRLPATFDEDAPARTFAA